MNKELEQRYKRIENELMNYIDSPESLKNKDKVKTNICNVNIIDLQNIVAKINTNSISVNDVFFKSIKPIVKTALTTVSVWNYLLENETRLIKTIRDFEDSIKNKLSELEEIKFTVKATMVNLSYIMLFLIKNGVELKITDILSISTNILDVMEVITDLTENCPLVKDAINSMFGESVLGDFQSVRDTLDEIIDSKTTNTNQVTGEFNDSYVDNVITSYKRFDSQTLDYNLDSYVEKLIDFTDRLSSKALPQFIQAIDVEIETLNAFITNSADTIVEFIMDIGFGDLIVSKEQLQNCLNVIIKHDKANKKEYQSYYEKLNRIPKTLGVFTINKNPYIVNKAKLSVELMKYYFARKEQDAYNYLSELIENLDCVIDKPATELTGKKSDVISKRDKNNIRSFTFFAIYYYGAGLILKFIQSQIDTSIKSNTEFENFVQKQTNIKQKELDVKLNNDIQDLDDLVLNAVDEIIKGFPTLKDYEKLDLINQAKKDIAIDYENLAKGYEAESENLYDETYNYYIGNTDDIDDLELRTFVKNQSSYVKDLVEMKNTLTKYFFDVDKNLGNVIELLSTKDYRKIIDSVTSKGINKDLDKEVVSFLNDNFIYDVYGNETLVILKDMGFEVELSSFVGSNDITGETPSLIYMIDKFSDTYSLTEKSYDSRNNLKNKLTTMINTYFRNSQMFKIKDIINEYYTILKEMKNNKDFIDYNGVQPQLDMLLRISEEEIDDFKESTNSEKFEFESDIYNVDFVDKMNRKANLTIENYIDGVL